MDNHCLKCGFSPLSPMSLGGLSFTAHANAFESVTVVVVETGGDGSAGKSMKTRIQIPSTHINTR